MPRKVASPPRRGSKSDVPLLKEALLAMVRIINMTKWSQAEFADYIGVHPQTVTNWISGHRSPDRVRCLGLLEFEKTVRKNISKTAAAEVAVVKEMSKCQ